MPNCDLWFISATLLNKIKKAAQRVILLHFKAFKGFFQYFSNSDRSLVQIHAFLILVLKWKIPSLAGNSVFYVSWKVTSTTRVSLWEITSVMILLYFWKVLVIPISSGQWFWNQIHFRTENGFCERNYNYKKAIFGYKMNSVPGSLTIW